MLIRNDYIANIIFPEMSLLETFALSVWCSKQLYTYNTWITLTYSLSDNLVMMMKLSYWNFHGNLYAAAAAKSLQSWPTLCDAIDGSPPGSPVPGVLQARTLEWVVISFNAWKWKVKVKLLSHVRLSASPWTAAYQDPPSMGFSRQEYWSGVPLPSPRNL